MSFEFVRLEHGELSEKNLPLPKHGYMILNCMIQTSEKWGCCWIVWRCHVFRVFIFIVLFRINIRKGYLDESVFRHCYGNFFESVILKVTWSQLCLKFLLKNCEAHSKQHFEEILQWKILRTWIKTCANTFIKTWTNIMKQKSTKVLWKL